MEHDMSLVGAAYELARGVYGLTARFPEDERPGIGAQLRKTALSVASRVADGLTTDDPAERQDVLRQAAIGCVTLDIELRIADDLGCLRIADTDGWEAQRDELSAAIEAVADGIARERRSVRH